MVGSCGADASMVASWVGWIRTLASVMVFSLDGIISLVGALSWSYGLWWFKEVRNGVRDFMCVISVRGLSSLDAWCGALLAFSQFSLALHDVFTNHFIAWRSSCNQREKRKTFSQPMEKNKHIFATQKGISQGVAMGLRKSFRSQRGVSQLQKFSQREAWGCEMISQQSSDFAEASFRLRNLADHYFSPVFTLFLAPKDLPSISLQFLLILIIQKIKLHINNTI